MKMTEVWVRPTPRVMLIQSAKLSPTVVHRILMTQNQTVTSGTLLSSTRPVLTASNLVVSFTTPDHREALLSPR